MKDFLVKCIKTAKEIFLFFTLIKPILVGIWNEVLKSVQKIKDIWK